MLSLEKCNEEKPCPLHNVLISSRQNILKVLKENSIADLALLVKNGSAYLPL